MPYFKVPYTACRSNAGAIPLYRTLKPSSAITFCQQCILMKFENISILCIDGYDYYPQIRIVYFYMLAILTFLDTALLSVFGLSLDLEVVA